MTGNKFFTLGLVLMTTLLLTSCLEDDPSVQNTTDNSIESNYIIVTNNVSVNTTWTQGNVYELAGRIFVEPGATLTIEPGVIVKGRFGLESASSALIVSRGANINAQGTPTLPIVFTCTSDAIKPIDLIYGNYNSPNIPETTNGQWGGIIILGNAPISASNENDADVSEVVIEGIPTSEPFAYYGGDDPNDNSGIFKYVSIRHGGTNIGNGNEINGLTLGGVGAGTEISNIEVVATQDDGIEIFGGSVDVSNVIIWNNGDDAIDTDQAWSGSLTNFVIVNPGDNALELDGPEGSLMGGHTISNGLVKMMNGDLLIQLDANSDVDLHNILFTNITSTSQKIDRVNAPNVTFSDIYLDVTTLSDYLPQNSIIPNGIMIGNFNHITSNEFSFSWARKENMF